ncbi:hypothetical protein VE01_03597 [Pseudogymnoascus verrucosus]|uniref:Ubiquitin 3 binding protein But2 C-terminal domain-containing protein n=1 Tax=Pseudogymnoascus verrucosus TaxID=342668 RepID=A0A1B8GRY5_9PEZI|nr:uncharacterized protein VE01_03597 [Pseudogymnoascus verrucosus]OBT98597.2 hypothetical protein VE01_03597 [Pseudogymnoascus verrucosus]
MRSFTFLAAASLAASAAAVPLDVSNDIAERQTKPYQIRGVQDPIYHLYLQSLPGDGTPVMGPEATSEYFTIGNTIQSTNTSLYLNIGEASTSYLPLTFDATATTTAWGLEGDTIITTNGSPYGRQLNFLVCNGATAGYYDLFLQKGSDTPAGKTCSNYQTIHLPCLC